MIITRLLIAGVVPTLLLLRLYGMIELAAGAANATTTVLYDGALNTGTPNTQGLFYAANGPNATQSFAAGVTTLDTTQKKSESAGYSAGIFNKPAPMLDRAAGYSVRFTTQLISEDHAGTNDRAGFSVIALSSDNTGIELGFWTDQIWAQDDDPVLFTHAEEAAFDTTAGLITYDLAIQGDGYALSSGGTSILAGNLRDYSAFGAPYTIKNFIFLGDDTSSAQAESKLSFVSVTTNMPTTQPTKTPTETPQHYKLFLPALMKPSNGTGFARTNAAHTFCHKEGDS